MADHSAIEWTEATWNPTTGCEKVSPGCDRCYAERLALRFPKTFPNGFALTLRPAALDLPLRWRRPRTIFVNSMSDLFHSRVPESYIAQVFDVMVRTPHHTYQVLTKRAERLARVARRLPWPPNDTNDSTLPHVVVRRRPDPDPPIDSVLAPSVIGRATPRVRLRYTSRSLTVLFRRKRGGANRGGSEATKEYYQHYVILKRRKSGFFEIVGRLQRRVFDRHVDWLRV
jgi:hypothetical protein